MSGFYITAVNLNCSDIKFLQNTHPFSLAVIKLSFSILGKISDRSDCFLNMSNNEQVLKRLSWQLQVSTWHTLVSRPGSISGVKPCCSANQPVREAARQHWCPLPCYLYWHTRRLPLPPLPHLGPWCLSCALRCTHISIMNSKVDFTTSLAPHKTKCQNKSCHN